MVLAVAGAVVFPGRLPLLARPRSREPYRTLILIEWGEEPRARIWAPNTSGGRTASPQMSRSARKYLIDNITTSRVANFGAGVKSPSFNNNRASRRGLGLTACFLGISLFLGRLLGQSKQLQACRLLANSAALSLIVPHGFGAFARPFLLPEAGFGTIHDIL